MEKHPSGISTNKCLTCVDDLWRSQLEPVSHLGCDERNLKPGHQHCVHRWRLLEAAGLSPVPVLEEPRAAGGHHDWAEAGDVEVD